LLRGAGRPAPTTNRRNRFSSLLRDPALPARMQRQRVLEHLDVAPPVGALHRRERGLEAELAQEPGLVNDEREILRVHLLRELDEQPRHGGDPDSVDDDDVALIEAAARVRSETGLGGRVEKVIRKPLRSRARSQARARSPLH